jgi:hypothetical protein
MDGEEALVRDDRAQQRLVVAACAVIVCVMGIGENGIWPSMNRQPISPPNGSSMWSN